MKLDLLQFPSPLGTLLAATESNRLCAVDFADNEARFYALLERYYSDVQIRRSRGHSDIATAFKRYFAGEFAALEELSIATYGTAFQERVWRHLRMVPAGKTTTYGEIARQLGQPTAARAVGLANGANPLSIVVPCHRVVGVYGALTGYAGGLERKRWLLTHEGAL